MSHFKVTIVTKAKPSEKEIAEKLQPFHEFECTGVDDKFVIDVDITQDCLDEYGTEKTWRLKDGEGKLHEPGNNEFYRDPTEEEKKIVGGGTGAGGGIQWHSRDWEDGCGYRAKVKFIPDGFTEVEVPVKDVMSLPEFIKEYFSRDPVPQDFAFTNGKDMPDQKWGWARISDDGEVIEVIRRTNPNKKWDWWVMGGRYGGSLLNNGIFPSKHDQLQISNIDFEGMKNVTIESKLATLFSVVKRRPANHPMMTEKSLVAEYQRGLNSVIEFANGIFNDAKKLYHVLDENSGNIPSNREEFKQFIKGYGEGVAEISEGDVWRSLRHVTKCESLEVWLSSSPKITSFALIDAEGNWREAGEMHMFAFVSNEDKDWPEKFEEFIMGLPPEYYLTVVDCHI